MGADLSRPPYTQQAVLSDGGVYDNLGLETIFKRYTTLLASDAGQKIAPEGSGRRLGKALRADTRYSRQPGAQFTQTSTIESYLRGDHTGSYWGIRANYSNYKLMEDPLQCAIRNRYIFGGDPNAAPSVGPRRIGAAGKLGLCDLRMLALRAHVDPAKLGKSHSSVLAFRIRRDVK